MTPKKLPFDFLHANAAVHRWGLHSPTPFSSTPFLPKSPSILATNVIKSYFEKGMVREARTLFDEMPERDVVAWSAMISGYTSCKIHLEAWKTFCEMLQRGHEPNGFTFSSVLKACKGIDSVSCGPLVHGLTVKHGVTGWAYVGNALVDMYATCYGDMNRANALFEEIKDKCSVIWTTLIAGYTHSGDGYGALRAFRRMLLEGAELSPFNLSIAIRACSSIGSLSYGKQIHAMVFRHKFESNIAVMNAVLDMYCRCSGLSEAYHCFQGMTERNTITWNTIIAGYEKSEPYEALKLYSRLEFEGITPDCFTFTSVVSSITTLAALGVGEQVHGCIIKRGHEDNLGMANALINMYAKCGSISDSHNIFDKMCSKNVISWTSMIIGYGNHGQGKRAVQLYDKMIQSGITPDRIVFVAVLNACSHNGLVEEGLKYFNSMVNDYNIVPDQEIYGCIVDLLGRSGKVKEAYDLIREMPFMPDESVWGAFLGACKAHKVANLGKLAAHKVLESMPSGRGSYLALSTIYAGDGKWEDFARLRKILRSMGRKKETGRSWIEVRNEVCSFVAGDRLGSRIEWVYEAVDMLIIHMKQGGHDDLEDLT